MQMMAVPSVAEDSWAQAIDENGDYWNPDGNITVEQSV